GLGTSEKTVQRALDFVRGLGKTPIVVRDVPGFATSRLGVILGAEAMRMLETGVASAADIDRGMELGYRHPMGPLKLTDLVGLDVRLAILDHLTKEIGDQFRPPAILRTMVRAGKLGKKTGEGFYKWVDGQLVLREGVSRSESHVVAERVLRFRGEGLCGDLQIRVGDERGDLVPVDGRVLDRCLVLVDELLDREDEAHVLVLALERLLH